MKTTSNRAYQIIIIGAGPAGLCLGQYLKAAQLDYCILESGEAPGWSWRHMPDWLTLLSFWKHNNLRPQDAGKFGYNNHVAAKDFSKYLIGLSKGLSIFFNVRAQKISRNSVFKIETSKGIYSAENVVLAVGYFSNPRLLNEKIHKEGKIPIKHLAQLSDYKFDHKKKYLVVGGGLSAGQIIEQLWKSKAIFDISCRSPIKFSAPTKIEQLFLKYLDIFEFLPKCFAKHKSSKTPMPHLAKDILSSTGATVRPELQKIIDGTVYFEDGSQCDYDEIILATGFEYAGNDLISSAINGPLALQQLNKGFESPLQPGLFFLGVDNQVDFTSRFLRGIRRDAAVLAKTLQKN